jgi:hypothetical protein
VPVDSYGVGGEHREFDGWAEDSELGWSIAYLEDGEDLNGRGKIDRTSTHSMLD